ncbi:MAG: hypothetical protein AAGC44_10530 [Planctomycetota bacterium]
MDDPTPTKRTTENHPSAFWLVAIGLLVLPLLVHAGSIGHPFLIDDHLAIAEHPQVTRFNGVFELWTSDYWADRTEDANLYRPITVLSYWLNWWVTPDAPAGFRVINLLLLGGIGLVLVGLLKPRTGLAAASIAAGVFVVHPVHGEVVNHIVGRADLLAALGIVSFLALQACALEHGWTKRRIVLAGLCTLVALGSKESGYALLPLALVQWWVTARRQKTIDTAGPSEPSDPDSTPNPCGTDLGVCRKRALLFSLLIPAALLIGARLGVVGAGTVYLPGSDDLTGNPLRGLGLVERLPEACAIFYWYLKQLVFPSLSFTQAPPPGGVGGWTVAAVVGGLLLLDCVIGSAWLALSRKRHEVVLAPALLLFHFLIVGNLLLATGVYAANRLTAASTAAGAIALGFGLAWVMRRSYRTRLAALIVGGGAVLVAGLTTVSHTGDWADELARMQADAEAQPDNPVALYWLGQAYLQAEQPARAIPALQRSVALEPVPVQHRGALVRAYVFAGKDEEAWAAYERIRTLPGLDAQTRLCGAMAAFNLEDYDQARREAIRLPPDLAQQILEPLDKLEPPHPSDEANPSRPGP